jgi:hypothetical protein
MGLYGREAAAVKNVCLVREFGLCCNIGTAGKAKRANSLLSNCILCRGKLRQEEFGEKI